MKLQISTLKKVALPVLLLLFFPFLQSAGAEPAQGTQEKSLKVLTVGNSFSICLERYFPEVVRSVPGCEVTLESIYIGGCSLERHWNNIVREEANPEDRHFKEFTYRQKLESQKWDIVSIQQCSPLSWKPETYFPYAEELCGYIAQYAPTAEIVIQQTWSYRADDKRLAEWGIDALAMDEQVFAAYRAAAEKLKLRVVPVGLAIHRARKNQPGGYEPLDRSQYTCPDLPDMSRYFLGNLRWNDNKQLEGDACHLNRRGEYLQACVWFALLYGRSAEEVTFVPEELTPEDALFLRQTAQKAVEEYQQVEGN